MVLNSHYKKKKQQGEKFSSVVGNKGREAGTRAFFKHSERKQGYFPRSPVNLEAAEQL